MSEATAHIDQEFGDFIATLTPATEVQVDTVAEYLMERFPYSFDEMKVVVEIYNGSYLKSARHVAVSREKKLHPSVLQELYRRKELRS